MSSPKELDVINVAYETGAGPNVWPLRRLSDHDLGCSVRARVLQVAPEVFFRFAEEPPSV
jgi:hypothetical protein